MNYERLTKRTSEGEIAIPAPDGRYGVLLTKDKNDIFFSMTNAVIDRLAELEDKLESGRLVELPKYGDTYWYVFGEEFLEPVVVTRVEVDMNQHETRLYAYGQDLGGLVGVIIFPTYKQAEARLKELQEGKK